MSGLASPGVHLLCVPWPGPASLSPRHANALEGNQLLNISVGAFPFRALRLHSGRSIYRNLRSILLSLHLWLTLAANPAPHSPTTSIPSHPSIKRAGPANFWTRREFFITSLLSEMFTHTSYMGIPRCSMRWKSLVLTLSEGYHDQVLSFI